MSLKISLKYDSDYEAVTFYSDTPNKDTFSLNATLSLKDKTKQISFVAADKIFIDNCPDSIVKNSIDEKTFSLITNIINKKGEECLTITRNKGEVMINISTTS